MSEKFVNIDRETPMLLPVDMREWLPEDHLAHFVIEVVGSMDLSPFSVNGRGTGSAQYPPSMLLALLVYCYATGRFSSRVIEQASYCDLAVRYSPPKGSGLVFRVRLKGQASFLGVLSRTLA